MLYQEHILWVLTKQKYHLLEKPWYYNLKYLIVDFIQWYLKATKE